MDFIYSQVACLCNFPARLTSIQFHHFPGNTSSPVNTLPNLYNITDVDFKLLGLYKFGVFRISCILLSCIIMLISLTFLQILQIDILTLHNIMDVYYHTNLVSSGYHVYFTVISSCGISYTSPSISTSG